jgi:hypothetical protein
LLSTETDTVPPSYEDASYTSSSSTPFFPGHTEASSSTPYFPAEASLSTYFPGHEKFEEVDLNALATDFGVLNLRDLEKPVVGKVALLIGNQNYVDDQLQLETPHNDVKVLRAALEKLNFKVMSLVDLTKSEMRKAILSFTTFLGRCMYAVFFFGGHGFEGLNALTGDVETFLVPVNATAPYNLNDGIKLQEDVLDTIQECDTAMNLIIVDCCRKWIASPHGVDSHNKSRRSVNLRSKGNTVFAYSTCPSKQAYETRSNYFSVSPQYSLYVRHLIKHIELDIQVEQVLKMTARDLVLSHHFIQIPSVVTNLIRDCKLTDPILDSDQYRNEQHLRWTNITELPTVPPFQLKGFSLSTKFYQQFSNELIVLLCVKNENPFPVRDFEIQAEQPGHGVTVSHQPHISASMAGSEGPIDQREFVAQISIRGLQRLEEGVRSLKLPVIISFLDDRDRVPEGITVDPQEIKYSIDLGNPLIAAASANWDAFVTGAESVKSGGQ